MECRNSVGRRCLLKLANIIFFVCVAILVACLIFGNDMLLLRSFLFPVGVVAGSALLTIIVSKVKKEWLLRKQKK